MIAAHRIEERAGFQDFCGLFLYGCRGLLVVAVVKQAVAVVDDGTGL
jgi:hypothetical protein